MSELSFVKEMMNTILKGTQIPKMQVERAVGPILGLFIDLLLTRTEKCSGNYKLISPEFPIKKKGSNQSTNMDFLLVDTDKNKLALVELKTDISSFNVSQARGYSDLKDRVSRYSATFLQSDLDDIAANSVKKYKYKNLLELFKSRAPNAENIKELIIVYIVPQAIKNKVKDHISETDIVLSFQDLPVSIGGRFSEEWKIIREKLIQLDGSQNVEIEEESRPNYQVTFDFEQAFLNNGTVFNRSGGTFNSKNLDGKETWEKFKDLVENT